MNKTVNKQIFSKESLKNCGFHGEYLLNIKNFGYMIKPMRAYKGATTSFVALFCFVGQVVCVFFTQNTLALKHTIPTAQINIAARARNCFSLFFI